MDHKTKRNRLLVVPLIVVGLILQILLVSVQQESHNRELAMLEMKPTWDVKITAGLPLTGDESTVAPEDLGATPEPTQTETPTLELTATETMAVSTETPTSIITETTTPTPTVTETPTPSATVLSSETPTATATSDEIKWEVDFVVPVSNAEVTSSGGTANAAEEISDDLQDEIASSEVVTDVKALDVSRNYTNFQVSVAGEDGLGEFRQTIFGDLDEQVDLLGGAVTLQITGEVKTGQVFPLILESNPSTGFIWEVTSYDSAMINVISESSFNQKYDMVGAPSTQTVRFMGLQDGTTTISLFYGRPWLSQQAVMQITVDAGSNLTEESLDLSSPVDENVPDTAAVDGLATVPLDESLTESLTSSFDWRSKDGSNWLTPVRNQGSCGSCWAFGTVGVFESAIKIQGGGDVDLSEQYLVSCNNSGYSCSGGWWAHNYHLNSYISPQTEAGAVLESAFPYTASNGSCSTAYSHPYKLTSWYYIAGGSSVPSVDQIKAAITTYGPVASAVCVGSGFSSYSGGVFTTDEKASCNGGVNHAILLVGWDDATGSWILRNSWGPYWGESGYMRIKWGISNVGYAANYVIYTNNNATPTAGPSPTATATAVPAVNDNIDNPTTVNLSLSSTYSTSESIAGATKAYDDPTFSCTSSTGYKSVWFKVIPPSSGTISVNTLNSNYDTILGIWQGTRGSLTSLGCNDDVAYPSSVTSELTGISVTANQVYYIEVASYSSIATGTLNFNLNYQPLPTATPTLVPINNVARGKDTSQSSYIADVPASRAVDGNTDGNWANNSVTHTALDYQAFWQVDLGASHSLQTIRIWNRTDCCSTRLSNYYVLISNSPFASTSLDVARSQSGVVSYYVPGESGAFKEIPLSGSGRYVRIQLVGTGYVSLAEVEIGGVVLPTSTPTITNTPLPPTSTPSPTATMSPINNVARGKDTSQSSYVSGVPASRAVDGNTDGNWANNSVTHTALDYQAFWQVDLGSSYTLQTIRIWNRTDCCSSRLSNYYVLVSDSPFASTSLDVARSQSGVVSYYVPGESGAFKEIPLSGSGRYVRIQLVGTGYVSLAEVEIGGVILPTSTPTITNTPLPPTSTPSPTATMSPINNVARGKDTSQSSYVSGVPASRAVDGNTDGNWANNSVTHTALDYQPFWQVDLGSSYTLQTIRIWNRTDCCSTRLSNYYVLVSNSPFASTSLDVARSQSGVVSYYVPGESGAFKEIPLSGSGRYVRIQLVGTGYVSLAEVEIGGVILPTSTPTITNTPLPPTSTPSPTATMSPINNVARGKDTSQSSYVSGVPASRAVDGNTDGNWANNSVTHTALDYQPFWQVDLGSSYTLQTIRIWNRTDCCSSRLSNYYVLVSDSPFASTSLDVARSQSGVVSYYVPGESGAFKEIPLSGSGRYVRIQLVGTGYVSLAEVEIGGVVLPTSTPTITNTPLPPTSTPSPTATMSPINNVARGKDTSQSSYVSGVPASRAVDGNTDGNWANNSVTHTALDYQPFWQVDLGSSYTLQTIRIWNRTDCCSTRLSNYYVLVSNSPFASTSLDAARSQSGVVSYYISGESGAFREIPLSGSGRYVRIQLSSTGYMSLAEVEIGGQPR